MPSRSRPAFAWYDATFAAGILILTAGLSLYSLALSVVVFGLLLCIVSLMAAQKARGTAPAPTASTLPVPDTETEYGIPDRAAA